MILFCCKTSDCVYFSNLFHQFEDDEGDRVLLATDDDLVSAVSHARGVGLKVLQALLLLFYLYLVRILKFHLLPLSLHAFNSLIELLCLAGCSLTEYVIPEDLCSLISLEDLLLANNYFRSLPSLAGLSKLKVLCLNACRQLLAIPDLPKNLCVLKANGCRELETIPDFSEMSNMRELYLCDSFKLTEVPGLDKSLNSMTRIHMEGCTNLTADFRNNILQVNLFLSLSHTDTRDIRT